MIQKSKLSQYGKKIRKLLSDLDRLSTRCLFQDPLIKGSPTEVYRKCGKATCKCRQGGDQRHGPYKVIQIHQKGKQKQATLRKDQLDLWDQAVHYQFQTHKLSELKELCFELQAIVLKVIEERTEEFPKK